MILFFSSLKCDRSKIALFCRVHFATPCSCAYFSYFIITAVTTALTRQHNSFFFFFVFFFSFCQKVSLIAFRLQYIWNDESVWKMRDLRMPTVSHRKMDIVRFCPPIDPVMNLAKKKDSLWCVSVCMPPLARSFQHNSLSIDFSSYFQSVACLYVPQCVCAPFSPVSAPLLLFAWKGVPVARLNPNKHAHTHIVTVTTLQPSSRSHSFFSALFYSSSIRLATVPSFQRSSRRSTHHFTIRYSSALSLCDVYSFWHKQHKATLVPLRQNNVVDN